jgi:hypothetical protein
MPPGARAAAVALPLRTSRAGARAAPQVPWLGEKLTMQLGLLGFTAQCVMIGLADTPSLIFASMAGSLLSNLVYPAMSSLVSRSVSADAQGEVLGTINGVRALTEGFGPLLFGALMGECEGTLLPGAPYLLAGGVSVGALVSPFLLLSYVETPLQRLKQLAAMRCACECQSAALHDSVGRVARGCTLAARSSTLAAHMSQLCCACIICTHLRAREACSHSVAHDCASATALSWQAPS